MLQKKYTIRRITLLALFLALAVLLNYVENLLPVFIPVPGVKLGLANSLNLIVLYFFTRKEYAALGFVRVILVSLLFTGLFSYSFFLSLSGCLLSTLLVLLLSMCKRFSIFSLSICSAIFHGIGQIVCACFLYQSMYMLTYLPVLLFSGLVSGFLIALLSSFVIERLLPFFKKNPVFPPKKQNL